MRKLSWLLALAVFAEASPPAQAQKAWEMVTSKEGQFTVEMPKRPDISRTRTRKNAGGVVRTAILGCVTEGGIYLVYRTDLPTAIVKGAEDAELDAVRDDIAQEWNGKVLTEKKVKAGLRVGRDFTIRGKSSDGIGVLTLRVRMYLDGKTIYAMFVGSAPNRELPDDAGRVRTDGAAAEGLEV